MKNVIHIFGASGSGTSTLGRKIAHELGYTFMDTDDYFWLPTNPPFTEKRPREERIGMMKTDIENADNVVLSGALADWGDALIPYFTLAIRLETEQSLRIARLRQREKARFGARIEPGGDMYQNHIDFIAWAEKYDTAGPDMRSRKKHDAWQTLLPCDILLLDGGDDPETNFAAVLEYLNK